MTYTGNETFLTGNKSIHLTIGDFWRWAYSDPFCCNNLSVLAEYIIASALGINGTRSAAPIKRYNFLTNTGLRVNVRTAAYVESRYADHPDCISFCISPLGIPDGNGKTKQTSDVYVFSIYKAMNKNESPLNLDFWEFYVLPASVLDKMNPPQKTITLPSLMQLEPLWCDYYGIDGAIQKALDKNASDVSL